LHLIVTQPAESEELPWTTLKRQAQRIGHHIDQQGDKIIKVITELPTQPLAIKLITAAGGVGDQVTLLTNADVCVEKVLGAPAEKRDQGVTVWCMSNRFFSKMLAPRLNLEENDAAELENIQEQCCCLIALKPNSMTQLPVKIATCIPSSALPSTFTYESEQGTEQRERPPYYYKQAGVIPWRKVNGEFQVMLITSNKNRYWGFPKGVMEPGESPEYTAAVEAQSEGGVLGEVGVRIGQFEVPKWGAFCTVDTFAMQVSEVLPRKVWQENHRNRHWCSIPLAKGLVRDSGFVELLKQFELSMQ